MKKLLKFLCLIIFLTSCRQSNLSPADMVEKGIEEYNNANYFGAAEWFRKAAEYDYDQAQNNLGILYKYGTGVEKDLAMAAYWFTKAAQQGNEDAIKNLERLHDFAGVVPADAVIDSIAADEGADEVVQYTAEELCGFGVAEYSHGNYDEAVGWLRQPADDGYAEAQSWLGVCYYEGKGVTQDYAEAAKWYRKAAMQGDEYAQYALGFMYFHGQGVAQNNIEAKKWLGKAAAQGNKDAKEELAKLNSSLVSNTTNNTTKSESVVSNSTTNNATQQANTTDGNKPIYESHYYYTGVMSSGGQVSAMNPLPAENVKIYADHIQFGRNFLYRLNGTYRLNGIVYQKYEAVDGQGNNMPNNFLLRDGTSLCEVTLLNILGFTTTTVSFINEGFPPQTSQSAASGNYSPSQSTTVQPRQQTARTPCTYCNGWGKVFSSFNNVYTYSTPPEEWCQICGKYLRPHSHQTCPSCGGKGTH